MDHFAAMKTFVQVAQSGGFSAAARLSGSAVSSLTRQTTALEKHLGVKLFHRSTHALAMTEDGHKYLAMSLRILADLEEANASLAGSDSHARGRLRVSAPVAFGRLYIAPLLHEFFARFPEISLELELTDVPQALIEQSLDVAIRLGHVEQEELIARKLGANRRIVCASPAYLKRCGSPLVPGDLTKHQCLLFAYHAGSTIWQFKHTQGAKEQVAVRGVLCANNSEVLLQAALDGLGVLLMPTWLVARYVDQGLLVVLLPDFSATLDGIDTAIFALYPAVRRHSAKVRAFVSFMEESLAVLPE